MFVSGCRIEINETGTVLRFSPGLLIGGNISHDCGLSRGIGWFVEALLPLAAFCQRPLSLSLTGVTHHPLDLSADTFAHVTLPLLQNFGLQGALLSVKRRGRLPRGGGEVAVSLPNVRSALKPVYIVDEGLVRRVRGVASASHLAPSLCARLVESARGVLHNFLPDVQISADCQTGKGGGSSPGYSLCLTAQATSGVLYAAEACALPSGAGDDVSTPEDVGRRVALQLLREIETGGVVDSAHQPLLLLLMALTPEDVSKVRLGPLTPQAVNTLRLLREVFGLTFKIQEERDNGRSSYLLTCMGLGFVNTHRKAT